MITIKFNKEYILPIKDNKSALELLLKNSINEYNDPKLIQELILNYYDKIDYVSIQRYLFIDELYYTFQTITGDKEIIDNYFKDNYYKICVVHSFAYTKLIQDMFEEKIIYQVVLLHIEDLKFKRNKRINEINESE
jgi:hypothetical protein